MKMRNIFDESIVKTVILFTITITTGGHTPSNNSDVMVTYNGHSEVGNRHIFYSEQNQPEAKDRDEGSRMKDHNGEGSIKDHDEDRSRLKDHNAEGSRAKDRKEDRSTKQAEATVTDDGVLFVPNVKPVVRNEDMGDEEVGVNDMVMRKLLKDEADKKVIVETESPNGEIVFISGKNNENDKEEKEKKESKKEKVGEEERMKKRMNCTNLDCDSNQEPVCGGKLEQKKWRYRLFMNRCFLARVNCGFRNPVNRYRLVDMQRCKDVALRSSVRPKSVPLRSYEQPPRPVQNDTRRSSPSRRSMTRGADGQFCSHSCPLSCTEEYEPQCVVSSAGQKQVFLNHCKLDLNSCIYGTMWQQRPLSWCVGGKAADARENRAFIAWMQRAGIVDRKGRLTLH